MKIDPPLHIRIGPAALHGYSFPSGKVWTHNPAIAKRNKWKLSVWFCYAFLFFTVYLPVTHNEFRGYFMALVVTIVLARIILNNGRMWLHRNTVHWILFYFVAGTGLVVLSYIRNAPGALFSSLVFVIWPLVYALMVEAIADPGRIVNVLRVLVFAMISIGAGTLYYLGWSLGWIPSSLYIDPQLVKHAAFFGGTMQMSHYSLSSLIFLLPFTLAALFVHSPRTPGFLPQWVIWLALSLGLFTAFVGGRRALFLVLLTAPVLILFFRSWLPHRLSPSRRRQLILAVSLGLTLLGVGFYLGRATSWSWEGTQELFLNGFDFKTDPDALARRVQFFALLHGWMEHPIIGAGLGTHVNGIIRNAKRPWEYELQYVLLLYQVGLVGVLIYSSGVVWIYLKAREMIRSGTKLGVHMVPVLVGTTSFLIANATNPYLQTFGGLWTLFLPVAMINSSLLFERSQQPSSKRFLNRVSQPSEAVCARRLTSSS